MVLDQRECILLQMGHVNNYLFYKIRFYDKDELPLKTIIYFRNELS